MRIKRLKIKNYRCFRDIEVAFDDKMTLLVGVNGSGKTSILDIIAKLLQTFCYETLGGLTLEKNDINIKSETINTYFEFNYSFFDNLSEDNICKIDFTEKDFQDGIFKKKPSFEEIKKLRHDIKDEEIKYNNKNIFVYYKLHRSIQKKDNNNYVNHKDGFVFSPELDFQKALKWFDGLDAEEARKIRETNELSYRNPVLETVRQALCNIFDNGAFGHPHIKDGELHLINKQDGKSYSIWQLSDGYRVMVTLAMDLACRVATAQQANFLEIVGSPLNAPGIVLIDEIELHLHPSWQQTVASRLQEVFPNIQFICSTHSPQVVTSVKPDQVRLLMGENDIRPPETSTYGAEAGTVLDEIFLVPQRPPNEVTQLFKEYYALINDGMGQSDEALKLRLQLEKLVPNDSLLQEADSTILLEKFRRERLAAHA